jgi:hypothetical protein
MRVQRVALFQTGKPLVERQAILAEVTVSANR